MESAVQHGAAAFVAGLQATGPQGNPAQARGAWGCGKRSAFPTSPHPRRRLRTNFKRGATLTIYLVQKIGQVKPIAGLPQLSRMRQVILLGIVPASCFEHSLLSKFRLALFGKRVRIIPLTNTNFIISCGGGFDEPRKHFKPSHTPPYTSRASLPRVSRLKHAQFCVAW